MLTPDQALSEILGRSKPLNPLVRPLEQSWGAVLAAAVRAPYPYPLFDNAALDGYAVQARDTASATTKRPVVLALQGNQYAGEAWRKRLKSGRALHVTTGAPMPPGTDALVPYEAVRCDSRRVYLQFPAVPGQNVRRQGEDGRKGSLLSAKGDRLHARRLAMLASFGVDRVKVAPRPRVGLAVSGDELVAAGRRPPAGKIFDSNGPCLAALAREAGVDASVPLHLPDSVAVQTRRLRRLLETSDVLVVAGGMSVGERDLGKSVLESLGVRRVFWKVAQKPGKPLYFGVRGRRLVFGLPGNPAALVACFAVYVAPCLRVLGREAALEHPRIALAHALPVCGDKALLLKARVDGLGAARRVQVLDGQGSHLLRSLSESNALVLRQAGDPALKRGSKVEILPL